MYSLLVANNLKQLLIRLGIFNSLFTFNFTFAVEFLSQTLLELFGVFLAVPLSVRVLHRLLRIFGVRERRQALCHCRFKRLQSPHYKVSDNAGFLKCLLSVLSLRRLDLKFAV